MYKLVYLRDELIGYTDGIIGDDGCIEVYVFLGKDIADMKPPGRGMSLSK